MLEQRSEKIKNMTLLFLTCLITFVIGTQQYSKIHDFAHSHELKRDTACDDVCDDLPLNDLEPVCMMFSRYKKGYLFFVNECQARRAVCKENMVLHAVHPSRCMRTKQFFMPIN